MIRTAPCLVVTLLLSLACTGAATPEPEPAEPAPAAPAPAAPETGGCTEEVLEPFVLEKVAEEARGRAVLTELHCAHGFAKVNVGGEGLDTALAVLREEGGKWTVLDLGTGSTPKQWCMDNQDKLSLEQCKELMRP